VLKLQLASVETNIHKTEEPLERFLLAFEAGTKNERARSARIARLTAHLTRPSV